jgi:hypothetical protein
MAGHSFHLHHRQRRQLIKTHGFGITNPRLLVQYPWYSADSTTWSLTPSYGAIIVPVYDNGKPDYTKPPQTIVVSGIPQSGAKNNLQLEGFGDIHHESVAQFVQDELGTDMAEVRYNSNTRRRAALIYYQRLMENLHDVRFNRHHHGFLGIDVPRGLKPIKIDHVQVVIATLLQNKMFSRILTEMEANTRLLSYYEIRSRSEDELREFVETGMNGMHEARIPKPIWNLEYRNWRALRLYDRIRAQQEIEE